MINKIPKTLVELFNNAYKPMKRIILFDIGWIKNKLSIFFFGHDDVIYCFICPIDTCQLLLQKDFDLICQSLITISDDCQIKGKLVRPS